MNLSDIERSLGVEVPATIRELYEAGDGRFNTVGQWWVIWPLDQVAAEAPSAWARGLPPTLLPFGDDGSGTPFCVSLDAPSNEVVRWNWIDGAVESSEGDVDSFVATWVVPPHDL